MDLQRRDLSQPGERRQIVHQRVLVGVILVFEFLTLHPGWSGVIQILLKEHHSGLCRGPDAVDPALPSCRPVADVREHDLRDGRVVGDHLTLGRAGCRIHHLVEMGELQPVSVDRNERRIPV